LRSLSREDSGDVSVTDGSTSYGREKLFSGFYLQSTFFNLALVLAAGAAEKCNQNHKSGTMRSFKKICVILFLPIMATLAFAFKMKDNDGGITTVSSFGKQPTLAVDKANQLHVVFGQVNEVFYTSSKDRGASFTRPVSIGKQPKLALGATRGPQIVCTKDYVVVAAADHTGKIMAYRLKQGENKWSEPVNILKGDPTAKEGFIALAAGPDNHVYAAWLDLRVGGHNNVFSASSLDGGRTWSDAQLVYASPEGRVCPCCRPSVSADKKGNVYVMFRNELAGARDVYLAHSKDGARSFAQVKKLGNGTWLLNQCPMDGGGVSVDAEGKVGSTWRRENVIYYCEPGKPEQRIGEGKSSALIRNMAGNYLAWQQGNEIMALTPGELAAKSIGTGIYPRLASLVGGSAFCIWESNGAILGKELL
jgi:hypothetical protein